MAYTAVKNLRSPLQLHLTSMGEDNAALHAFEAIGFRKWLLHVHAGSCWETFDHDRLVVLSPDAEEDLEEVDESRIYVIGGIVDRTVRKLQSRDQAEAQGAQCLRRIPIKRHGPQGMHPVLNIDTVV